LKAKRASALLPEQAGSQERHANLAHASVGIALEPRSEHTSKRTDSVQRVHEKNTVAAVSDFVTEHKTVDLWSSQEACVLARALTGVNNLSFSAHGKTRASGCDITDGIRSGCVGRRAGTLSQQPRQNAIELRTLTIVGCRFSTRARDAIRDLFSSAGCRRQEPFAEQA